MSDSEADSESSGASTPEPPECAKPNPNDGCPISPRWLSKALSIHHKESVFVRTMDVRPGCGAGQAALSDVLAVSADYVIGYDQDPGECDNKASEAVKLVVKLPPRDPFSRYFVAEAQFDLREIMFYTQVVPDLEKVKVIEGEEPIRLPVPKCFHAHYKHAKSEEGSSPEPSESALILEDIRPLGFKTADFSDGLSLKQAEAAVKSVAKIHAVSLVLSSQTPTPLTEKYPFLFQSARASDSYQQLLQRGLPQLVTFLRERPVLDGMQTALEALRPKTRQLIEALLKPIPPMSVITHTDFWCNNLMFKEKDGTTECCVLDWQMVTLSRPTNDLALLLVSSVCGDVRRRHEQTLLDLYLDQVSTTCKTLGADSRALGWTHSLIRREYRRSKLLALLLCLGSVDVALGDPKAETRLEMALQDAKDEGLVDMDFVDEQLTT